MTLRFKTSLARKYYKYLSRTRHKIVKINKAEFCVRPDNYIDRHLWIEGGYEKEQLSHFIAIAHRYSFDIFIDIGANFGLYSCIMGVNKIVPQIHSFECDYRNLYQLYGHIAMNQLFDIVTVHPFAAGNKDETKEFCLATDNNSGKSKILNKRKDTKQNIIKVRQVRPDDIIDIKNQNVLIKIDVEGYEKNVLKGMAGILKNNKCYVQTEILDEGLEVQDLFANYGLKKVNQIEKDCYFTNMDL